MFKHMKRPIQSIQKESSFVLKSIPSVAMRITINTHYDTWNPFLEQKN